MHTTLYRPLALLVSIFALTSSFSLSTETKSVDDFKDSFDDIHLQPLNNTTGTKDQSSWIFEWTYDQETFYRRKNAGKPEEIQKNVTLIDNDSLQEMLTIHSEKLNLTKKKLRYAFSIYREDKEKKIIGIIFKDQNGVVELMLYDKEFEPLKDEYTKAKRLILEERDSDPFSHNLSQGPEKGYVLGMQWEKETNETEKTSITLFYDKQSNMKIQKGLAIPGPDRSMGRKSTSREKWKKILLGCAFLGICIYIIYKLYIHIYNQGCFSKKSSQRKPGR